MTGMSQWKEKQGLGISCMLRENREGSWKFKFVWNGILNCEDPLPKQWSPVMTSVHFGERSWGVDVKQSITCIIFLILLQSVERKRFWDKEQQGWSRWSWWKTLQRSSAWPDLFCKGCSFFSPLACEGQDDPRKRTQKCCKKILRPSILFL